jgi:hypothetical protein
VAHVNSIGAYPDQANYDPGRPSWLPYWIDTFDEEAKRYGLFPDVNLQRPYPDPVPLPRPAAPQTADELRNWTPAQLDARNKQNFEAWKKSALPYNPVPDSGGSSYFLILAAAALVVFAVVRR